jgi:hypothetical protein
MSLSSDDAQKLVEFLQFLDQNKDLMVGYNTKVPVETYLMIGSLTVLVRYKSCLPLFFMLNRHRFSIILLPLIGRCVVHAVALSHYVLTFD